MKPTQRTIGAAILSVAVVLMTGCNTPIGQQFSNTLTSTTQAFAQSVNNIVSGALAQISPQQQQQLQQQSPQTFQTLQHNDDVAKQQQQASANPTSGQPASAADAPTPLKVDDIKAMAGAGIKPDAIIDAIKESKTTYNPSDIEAAEQINPPLDPSVITFMKNPTS